MRQQRQTGNKGRETRSPPGTVQLYGMSFNHWATKMPLDMDANDVKSLFI